ncbi:MAG: hybrid sensor histidine kinase/response regulator [Burkholderiaceae bacterium]
MSEALNESIESALLKSLATHAVKAWAAVLAAVVLAGLAIGRIPVWIVTAWFGAAVLAQFGRVRGTAAAALDRSGDPRQQVRRVVALAAAAGVVMGVSVMCFPWLSEMERAVFSMVHIGMAAGTVATSVGYRPIMLAHGAPPFVVLMVMWLMTPFDSLQPWVPIGVAALIALLAFIIVSLSRDTFVAFRESFEIRSRRNLLNQQLREAVAAADSASRAKTRFLAAASHDLRQPLHALSMLSGTLLLRKLDARSHKIAEQINTATNDLSTELDALLDISKLDAGVMQPRLQGVDAENLVRRLVESHRPRAEQQGLQLQMSLDEGVYVLADRLMLERVLRNLLDNAIKYTHMGSIFIEIKKRDGQAIVAVSDTGIGLSADEQTRVFDEFYQVDSVERSRRRGLGLGLSIVRRLVHLQGGSLDLRSSPGRGSTFSVRLPLAERAAEPANEAPLPGRVSRTPGTRVLVVDDEAAVREAVRAFLEEAGCLVRDAADQDGAKAVLAEFTPQIVLADLQLAGAESGIEVIRQVRAVCPQARALLISGVNEAQSIRLADQAGLRLLHKPVNSRQIIEEIEHALGEPPTGAAP